MGNNASSVSADRALRRSRIRQGRLGIGTRLDGYSKASVLQPCTRKGSEAREAGLFACDERSLHTERIYTIESTSVLLRFVAGNGDGSQGGSSSRNDAGGWTFDLFETRRASPKQRTREEVTMGCSRLVEWGLWRSQWESNLDSVNLGQTHSSVTRRNALLAASEQTGNGPEATCPGNLQKHARGIDAIARRCPRIVVVLQKSVDDVAHDDSPTPVGECRSC